MRRAPKVARLCGFWFILTLGLVFQQSACDTLFVKRAGIAGLPLVYATVAAGWLAGSQVFLAYGDRIPRRRLLRLGLLAAAAFAASALLVVHWLSAVKGVYYFIVIVNEGLWLVLGLAFWTLCNDVFELQDAKRSFALIAAGQVVGFVVAGCLSQPVVSALSVSGLFLLSLAIYLALAFLGFLALPEPRRHPPATGPGPQMPVQLRAGLHWMARRPFFITYSVMAALMFMFIYGVRFEYVVSLDALAKNEGAFAVLYAHMWALINATVAGLQVLVLPGLARRFASIDLILLLPVVAAAVASLQVSRYTASGGLLAWIVVNVAVNALDPVYQTFSNPVPGHLRGTVQTLTTGLVKPAGVLLAAVAMYLRAHGQIGAGALYGGVLAACFVYAAIWGLARRQYVRMLEAAANGVVDATQIGQELALCAWPGKPSRPEKRLGALVLDPKRVDEPGAQSG